MAALKNPPAVAFEPEFVEALRELFEKRVVFNTVLGLQITGLAPEGVAGRIAMKPELIGHFAHQRLHGGVISATLDAMGGLAVMAILSLLPAVGAAMVWGPVALYLLTTGSVVEGVGLIVWGVFVIGLVDNVLRPILVGKDTQLPDYVVLISTVGGLALIGINGFVIGPLIAAMFMVSWEIFSVSQRATQEDPASNA